jgi:hypothetical protein
VTQQPSVGRIVHYVSYGTPGGEFKSECRAAIITEVPDAVWQDDAQPVGLAVLNPTGMFFNRDCVYHGGDAEHVDATPGHPAYRGGTWHWPERV